MSNLSNLTAVILAGGLGIRLQKVVADRPKPMSVVNGRPFLEFLVAYLKYWQIRDIVFCIGFMGGMIENHFNTGKQLNINARYSSENRPLGTAGALKHAQSLITSEPFLVLNGDSIVNGDLHALLTLHLKKQACLSILLAKVNETRRYGSVSLALDQRIISFVEKESQESRGLVSAGVYIMNKSVLKKIPEDCNISLEHDIFPQYVSRNFYGMVSKEPFIDIGTPESYARANEILADWKLDG